MPVSTIKHGGKECSYFTGLLCRLSEVTEIKCLAHGQHFLNGMDGIHPLIHSLIRRLIGTVPDTGDGDK